MSKKAFDQIMEGLNEALEVARGNAKPSKLHVPPEVNVRAIREKLKLSQDGFAARFGFTINQIRDWEQGRSNPHGSSRAYLMVIQHNPKAVLDVLRRPPEGRGRRHSNDKTLIYGLDIDADRFGGIIARTGCVGMAPNHYNISKAC
jgi:putative transcriptional regulator